MEITNELLLDLALEIKRFIEDDFSEIFLSGNLADTLKVGVLNNTTVYVDIPARMYDIEKFRQDKVVVYNKGDKSYADEVDRYGGFSGEHVNYVERAINNALESWSQKHDIDFKRR